MPDLEAQFLYFLANGTHTDVVIAAGGGVVSMRSLAGLTHSEETPFDPVSFYREIRITLGRLPESVRRDLHEARFGGTPSSAQKLFAETRESLRKLGIDNVAITRNAADEKSRQLSTPRNPFSAASLPRLSLSFRRSTNGW